MGGSGGGGFTGDPFEPIGWDPGGGGPDPIEQQPTQPVPQANNPCEKVDSLSNSELFRTKMANLIKYTSKNFEAGYIFRSNSDGTFSYEYMRGPEGTLHIDFVCGPLNQIFGFIHTHPAHALPIFSPSDIRAIYLAYKANCIGNLQFLPIGLVTPQGAYLLVVNNVQNFLAFGAMFLRNHYMFTYVFQGAFAEKFSQYRNPEIAFLRLLEHYNMGLMLFEGSHADFSQWQALKLDYIGTPVVNPNPC